MTLSVHLIAVWYFIVVILLFLQSVSVLDFDLKCIETIYHGDFARNTNWLIDLTCTIYAKLEIFREIIIGVCFNVECKLNRPNLPDTLVILGQFHHWCRTLSAISTQ